MTGEKVARTRTPAHLSACTAARPTIMMIQRRASTTFSIPARLAVCLKLAARRYV